MKIFFMLIFLFTTLDAQQFSPKPFITIAGDNQNVFVSQNYPRYDGAHYICWENHVNDRYRILMRRISPDTGSIVTVANSIHPLRYPQIQVSGSRISLAWKMEINNRGRIYYKSYLEGVPDSARILSDTTRNAGQPGLGQNHVAWVSDSTLLILPLDSTYAVLRLPCKGCSKPILASYDDNRIFKLYYRQQTDSIANIVRLNFNNYYTDSITSAIISGGKESDSPRSTFEGGIVFRQQTDNAWHIVTSDVYDIDYSLKNLIPFHPYYYQLIIFTVGGQLESQPIDAPRMLIFDAAPNGLSDIYFNNLEYGEAGDTINVSQSPYPDQKPVMTVIPSYEQPQDSTDLVIFWEHTGANNKSDIYWARYKYFTPTGLDEAKQVKPETVELIGNYPNPFNPSTIIRYRLSRTQKLKLLLFDASGHLIRTLFSGVQPAGVHQLTFEASDLASGIYFYRLQTGGFMRTKKMLLLR